MALLYKQELVDLDGPDGKLMFRLFVVALAPHRSPLSRRSVINDAEWEDDKRKDDVD